MNIFCSVVAILALISLVFDISLMSWAIIHFDVKPWMKKRYAKRCEERNAICEEIHRL